MDVESDLGHTVHCFYFTLTPNRVSITNRPHEYRSNV